MTHAHREAVMHRRYHDIAKKTTTKKYRQHKKWYDKNIIVY